ncbi:hypothetical protein VOLCADRAFT_105511 [Volvox carteri f. nagariensis]|uniref:Polycystin cation channel PKD1/PKD2 domain-containing protein n=1 Tax=Volvox carteri f. nagariensis TaxID=3068 RepID=D8U1B8_VOLCA|nr:uncharacterized protein VOLCADRAFT_105511 [Volvox carteri f. nagariensis]EFJ46529.1 hypothetical protein VOLCADRAFT_105511 [Volvox carteri f. nagariensis]|eukprot:XP_002952386.1 hypothetical protein VOLCADRAFT_105511 [Volvox carteri f. nagariensis]
MVQKAAVFSARQHYRVYDDIEGARARWLLPLKTNPDVLQPSQSAELKASLDSLGLSLPSSSSTPGRYLLPDDPAGTADWEALAEVLVNADGLSRMWTIYGMIQAMTLVLLFGRLLSTLAFQGRVGIMVRTLFNAVPAVLHLVIILLLIAVMFSVMEVCQLGIHVEEMSNLDGALSDTLGLLVGRSILRNLDTIVPRNMEFTTVQVSNNDWMLGDEQLNNLCGLIAQRILDYQGHRRFEYLGHSRFGREGGREFACSKYRPVPIGKPVVMTPVVRFNPTLDTDANTSGPVTSVSSNVASGGTRSRIVQRRVLWSSGPSAPVGQLVGQRYSLTAVSRLVSYQTGLGQRSGLSQVDRGQRLSQSAGKRQSHWPQGQFRQLSNLTGQQSGCASQTGTSQIHRMSTGAEQCLHNACDSTSDKLLGLSSGCGSSGRVLIRQGGGGDGSEADFSEAHSTITNDVAASIVISNGSGIGTGAGGTATTTMMEEDDVSEFAIYAALWESIRAMEYWQAGVVRWQSHVWLQQQQMQQVHEEVLSVLTCSTADGAGKLPCMVPLLGAPSSSRGSLLLRASTCLGSEVLTRDTTSARKCSGGTNDARSRTFQQVPLGLPQLTNEMPPSLATPGDAAPDKNLGLTMVETDPWVGAGPVMPEQRLSMPQPVNMHEVNTSSKLSKWRITSSNSGNSASTTAFATEPIAEPGVSKLRLGSQTRSKECSDHQGACLNLEPGLGNLAGKACNKVVGPQGGAECPSLVTTHGFNVDYNHCSASSAEALLAGCVTKAPLLLAGDIAEALPTCSITEASQTGSAVAADSSAEALPAGGITETLPTGSVTMAGTTAVTEAWPAGGVAEAPPAGSITMASPVGKVGDAQPGGMATMAMPAGSATADPSVGSIAAAPASGSITAALPAGSVTEPPAAGSGVTEALPAGDSLTSTVMVPPYVQMLSQRDEDTTNYDAFKEWVGEVPRAAKGAAGKRRRGGGDDDDLGARSGRKVGNKRQKGNKGAGWGRGASKGTTRAPRNIHP